MQIVIGIDKYALIATAWKGVVRGMISAWILLVTATPGKVNRTCHIGHALCTKILKLLSCKICFLDLYSLYF